MITRGAVAVLAGIAGLTMLLTACATPIEGTARPAEPPLAGGLPLPPEKQRKAELFAEVRSWDMCAMHDVDAAAEATGFVPDELLPYREPGICRLVMKEPSGVTEWELQLDVFPVIPAEGGSPIEVGGRTLQQVRDIDENRCVYSLPIGPETEPWGIEMSVYNVSANRPPCDVAREYAAAIVPRMEDPPLRSARATTPALGLAASDPCALAAAGLPVLSEAGVVPPDAAPGSRLEPYACSALFDRGGNPSGELVEVSAEFTLANPDELGSATVAGFPAVRNQRSSDCAVVFAPSDVVLSGNPGMSSSVPAVEVAGPCEQIDGLAEAAAGALTPPPSTAPRDDATVLGDLDPPPTAAAVDAPFDPCTVVSWADYPAHVQPDAPGGPVPSPVRPEDPFAVGCTFTGGGMFSLLAWGMPDRGFTADPAVRGDPADFSGRPGVQQRGVNEASGDPSCYSAVQLAEGIAAMSTTLPDDPCAVNRAVLDKVAERVP